MTVLTKGKVKQGVTWVLVQRIILRSLNFVRVPILARLLSPHDFGLAGIITTILFFIEIFTRTGFQAALIQRKENVEDYLDVGWTVNLFKGIFEMVILLILVKPLAAFYQEPSLDLLLLASALTFLTNSLESIRLVMLYRRLDMGLLSKLAIATNALTFVLTVVFAFVLKNVWALMMGMIVQSVINTMGSYIIAPYRPRFNFNMKKARELWSFGKWEFASSILMTTFMQGDNLFVGKVLGVTALGFYSMAYNLGNAVSAELVDSLRGVIFPAFSAIQDDVARLRKSYLTVYHFTASIGVVIAVGLCLLSPEFVDLFLGSKWAPMIPTLQVLAIWGGVQMLSTSTLPLFRAVNRPDWWAKIQALKVVLLALLIYPFSIWWGITGTGFAALIASLLEIPLGIYLTRRTLACGYRDIVLPLAVPVLAGLAVAGIYFLATKAVTIPGLFHLILFGCLIVFAYITVALVIDRYFNAGLLSMVRNVIGR